MKNIITRFFQSPKRIILSGSIVLGFLTLILLPATALAATPSCTAKDVQCVITFGDQQITARIAALNKLSGVVTGDHNKKLIDDDHATSIQNDITTNINGLNALKATLDAETSATNARQDVEKIYTQFRIYAVVLPRDYRRVHLAIEITVDAKLKALEPTVEKAVDNAPADKKDEVTNLFNDFKDQLADAESKIDAAQSTWPLLTPDSYNSDRATYTTNLKSLTSDEQTAHTDLHKAAADLHQITQDLKK